MSVLLRLSSKEVKSAGVYLTDGKRLFRVLDSCESEVKLEDSGRPEENPTWWPVKEVLETMERRVVPEDSRS